jgi:acyl-CoA synthetase (AMP-forming)/AMP-acid ligase II/acyl carrier protein
MYPPGLDFVIALFGCFRAGVVAVPVPAPDPRDVESGLRRVERVAADAGASIILTTDAVWAALQPWAGRLPALTQLEWCATDALRADAEPAWRPRIVERENVALLQYTSGSTGTPRGVIVTHANILAHGRGATTMLALSSCSVVVGWLPLYHDMGLVGTVFIPMQVGCPAVHLAPSAFLQRPLRWMQALSRYGGTVSPAPNFAYDLCVRKTTPADRRDLDLSRWTAAMNGAEPVRADTCERFVTAFEPYGFRRTAFVPCYGLAESTLMVAGGPVGTPPMSRVVDGSALDRHRLVDALPGSAGSRTIVGCGQIMPDHQVAVAHPDTGIECGPDHVGELWVAGPCVAAGYWSRPADTTATFGARLAGQRERGDFLRTGDLGFVRDGVVFVTGRRKDLIVVRGRNHYPQDIEYTAEHAHAALRPGCGAAFSLTDQDEDRLAIIHEIDPNAGAVLADVARAIRAAIAREHQLHAHVVALLPPRTLPKTSSGKIRRRETRSAFQAGRLPVIDVSRGSDAPAAPPCGGDDLGAWIIDRIAELRDVPPSEIGRDEVFLELGIDSAEAAELVTSLEERVGREIPMRVFLEHPTIDALARALAGAPA